MSEAEIAKLEEEIKRLKKLAYIDELTGLFNRHGFKEEAARFLKELTIPKKKKELRKNIIISNMSLAIFDADNFKKINDTYGHPAGDSVLKAFAQVLTDRVRDIDIAARWGGEEFLVGLIGASEKDAADVAENIRKRAEAVTVRAGDEKVKFTVSAGVTSFSGADSFEELLSQADKALYAAKNGGRNKVIRFSEI